MKTPEGRIAELEQRLLKLEIFEQKETLAKKHSLWRVLHEIQTVPCTSSANDESDMVLTHLPADPGVVYVAPFKFSGKIFLKRLSLICSCTAGNSSFVGMALYALDNPERIDRSNPLSGSTSRLRKLHTQAWIEATDADHYRLNLEFPVGFILDSTKAIYYAGWTIEDPTVGKVFCPNATAGVISFEGTAKTLNTAFRTNGLVPGIQAAPSSPNDFVFPDNVTINGSITKPVTPCVVARSSAGIRAFGSYTDDV